MTKIILVRHAQSEGNLGGFFCGQIDVPLSKLGHIQASYAGEFLKNEKIDAAYCSDLSRARSTAEHICAFHNIEPINCKELREIYAGDWQGVPYREIINAFPNDGLTWKNDFPNAVCTGGESVRELFSRVTKKFAEIISENEGKTVLIVTHANPIRAIFSYISCGKADMMSLKDIIPNASVSVFGLSENGYMTVYLTKDDFIPKNKTTDKE